MQKKKILSTTLAIIALFGTGSAVQGQNQARPAQNNTPYRQVSAEMPQTAGANAIVQASEFAIPKVVAEVNKEEITGQQLASEAIRLHGQEVLSARIKRCLIERECNNKKIKIKKEHEDAEIQRMAETFGLTISQWQNQILGQRNITMAQFREDTIWPMLAIQALSRDRLNVSEEEINIQMESLYGPAVQVREIAVGTREEAERLRAQVAADPNSFANVAMSHSISSASAPYGGLIPPVRRYNLDKNLENVIFSLKPGDVSQVVEWPKGNYIIYKCEQHFLKRDVDLEAIREQLIQKVKDNKMQTVAAEVFLELENNAVGKVELTMFDPALAKQYPGVAARVYDRIISKAELARLCVQRHGEEVLDIMIRKKLILQECQKRNIALQWSDLEADVRKKASEEMLPKPDGSPNVERWLKLQLEGTGMTYEVFMQNVVWPVLALRHLSLDQVKLNEEDIQKGFDANYGPRVRCLAIVFDNQRIAQDVWMRAKNAPNQEYFGDLAAQFSVEPASKDARGLVPPIQKYGGQPELEAEAFKLKPGHISPIIQVEDLFVVLYCLEFTKPVVTDLNEVREEIKARIFEKKLVLAMERTFSHIYSKATIMNYLTGKSHSFSSEIPEASTVLQPAGTIPVNR